MIRFNNGYEFDYGCASGAMGFYGDGWWFEKPSFLMGSLRPREFTIIIKTLTYCPRKGNYRWWAPWRCVRLLKDGGVVNAVGLSNPGYEWWMNEPYQHVLKQGYNAIVSIMPRNVHEAAQMILDLNHLKIVGVQLNVSCPNVEQDHNVDFICKITEAALKYSEHPVTVKLSYQDDYLTICKALDGKVAAFELINTVPFNIMFPGQRSPLEKYKLVGGVSGKPIKHLAVEALTKVKSAGVKTPIISGGGIENINDVIEREALGADAIVFGSIFMRRPSLPNLIIDRMRRFHKRRLTV